MSKKKQTNNIILKGKSVMVVLECTLNMAEKCTCRTNMCI